MTKSLNFAKLLFFFYFKNYYFLFVRLSIINQLQNLIKILGQNETEKKKIRLE
jgi:hypothetical protein